MNRKGRRSGTEVEEDTANSREKKRVRETKRKRNCILLKSDFFKGSRENEKGYSFPRCLV